MDYVIEYEPPNLELAENVQRWLGIVVKIGRARLKSVRIGLADHS
jgi:hypothetical protein